MKRSKRNTAVGPQIREGIKKRGSNKTAVSIVVVSFVGAVQTATQYFAYKLHYDPALGKNMGHVYPTWDIFTWLLQGHYQKSFQIFQMAGSVGMCVAAGGVLMAAIAKMCDGKKPEGHEYLHGSARWANLEDIERSGLMPKDDGESSAVYVGAWKDEKGNTRYLRHAGPEHVLTFAPTRSGKGVGLVIPTMLSWRDSVVITDIKGELWALTSGWRQKYAGNKVIKWEPASETSARWNPLQEVRKGTTYETSDIQNIAQLIVDPDGKGLKDHWDRTAFSTLVGMITHAIYNEPVSGKVPSLGEVDRMLADPEKPTKALWEEMQNATYYTDPKTGEKGPHPVAVKTARDMLETPEEELGSKISTIKSHLSLYRDSVILRNTEYCDYRIKDLMHRTEPVSLYLVTQPADKARLTPLVKLKLNMIMRLLTAEMNFENGQPKANYKHRLLMMLDEFPSLGKMDILQESLAFCAGYGIKAYLITQDLNQLTAIYGKDESVTSNCHIQNAYPPNRQETAEHLSKLCGTTTIVKESISESGKGFNKSITRSFQETARPLLTSDEALRMPGPKKNAKGQIEEGGDMVIFVAGFPAVYGKQILYFKDKTFLARAKVPAPANSDILEAIQEETPQDDIRAEQTSQTQAGKLSYLKRFVLALKNFKQEGARNIAETILRVCALRTKFRVMFERKKEPLHQEQEILVIEEPSKETEEQRAKRMQELQAAEEEALKLFEIGEIQAKKPPAFEELKLVSSPLVFYEHDDAELKAAEQRDIENARQAAQQLIEEQRKLAR